MNLSELQAFLEDSNWDDEPEPAHPSDALAFDPMIPTLMPEPELQNAATPASVVPTAPVKLVPRQNQATSPEPELRATESVRERLLEVEMAQKMGYLLCKCSWPPQIMVLTGTDHVYRCRRCSRVREM